MAEELQKAFGVNPRLIPGVRGVFDVMVDGEAVFSKHQTGRFPEPGEIPARLQK